MAPMTGMKENLMLTHLKTTGSFPPSAWPIMIMPKDFPYGYPEFQWRTGPDETKMSGGDMRITINSDDPSAAMMGPQNNAGINQHTGRRT